MYVDFYKKYYRISIISEFFIVLISLFLFILLPSRMERTLFIAADPGDSRICYYIPGKLVSADALSGTISEIHSESYKGGSLLCFALEKNPGEDEITEVSIAFQCSGTKPKGQTALPADHSFLEWAEENTACQYASAEEGYFFAAKQEGDYNTGHFYSLDQPSGIIQKWQLWGSLILGGVYLFILELTAFWGRSKRKNKDRKYWKLDELAKKYILAQSSHDAPPLLKKNRRVFKGLLYFQYVQKLFLLVVVGQWFARLLDGSLKKTFFTGTLGALLLSFLLYYILYFFLYIKEYKKILSIGDRDPAGAARCLYDLTLISAPVHRWTLSDLNLAVFMMKTENYRESALFSRELWHLCGKRKQGTPYLQYLYVQCCCFHYMGKEKQAGAYLEAAWREISKNPKNKYGRKVASKLKQLQPLYGQSDTAGSSAPDEEVRDP